MLQKECAESPEKTSLISKLKEYSVDSLRYIIVSQSLPKVWANLYGNPPAEDDGIYGAYLYLSYWCRGQFRRLGVKPPVRRSMRIYKPAGWNLGIVEIYGLKRPSTDIFNKLQEINAELVEDFCEFDLNVFNKGDVAQYTKINESIKDKFEKKLGIKTP